MRADSRTVLTVVVFAAAAAAAAATGALHLARTGAERRHDAMAAELSGRGLQSVAHAAPLAEPGVAIVALRGEPATAETLELLHALAERSEVVLTSCRPVPASEGGRVVFQASGHAGLRALCAFLGAVELHERVFAIGTARLRPAGPDRVGFEIALGAFHREEAR